MLLAAERCSSDSVERFLLFVEMVNVFFWASDERFGSLL